MQVGERTRSVRRLMPTVVGRLGVGVRRSMHSMGVQHGAVGALVGVCRSNGVQFGQFGQ